MRGNSTRIRLPDNWIFLAAVDKDERTTHIHLAYDTEDTDLHPVEFHVRTWASEQPCINPKWNCLDVLHPVRPHTDPCFLFYLTPEKEPSIEAETLANADCNFMHCLHLSGTYMFTEQFLPSAKLWVAGNVITHDSINYRIVDMSTPFFPNIHIALLADAETPPR
jgi:hypothetical protein